MMLDKIKEALEAAFDLPVYYGTSMEASGKKIYDYIVFWRDRTEWQAGSHGDPSDYYTVALVRRDFIPENQELEVFDVLKAIPGLKETGTIQYDYITEPGTKLALEVAQYTLVAPRKRV